MKSEKPLLPVKVLTGLKAELGEENCLPWGLIPMAP